VRLAVAAILLLLVAFDARAASGEAAHGPNFWMLAVQAFNAGILLFVLIRYAGPALRDFFQTRSLQIRESIEGAQAQLEEAEAEIAELRARLAEFEGESGRLVESAAQSAEGERARTLERANATARRIREDAERVADSEIERARQALRAEAARLATELAGQLLRDETTREDDARLVGEFIDELGGSA
jgi:F0F1-type ATP synthase membrane subunit b/b'